MTEKNAKQVMETIFEYEDYRIFLNDYFVAKKLELPSFSQRYFAKKAGFNAHNFCTLVLQGKRNLSIDSINKITRAIGLRGKPAIYFENLVFLNQAITITDKDFYFQRLKQIGKKTQFYQLNKDQFFFYEKWYYPVIRELLTMRDWRDDYVSLAKSLRPQITSQEAREAVELLESSGMVCRDKNGRFNLTDKFVTSATVPDFIKKKARRDVLLRGIETIDLVQPHEKYAAYATVSMSKKVYEVARSIMDDARQRVHALVDDDGGADEVYEVVFQVFPVSNLNHKDKKV